MGRNWWPSPWGPADERGAYNRITPAKVLEAARLIRTGKMYPLAHVLEPGIPLFGVRHVSIVIPGGPTGGPFGTHQLYYNDEMFSGEIGQLGSQFDGLGHISARVGNTIRYYNGLTQEQVGGAYGLQKLGLTHLPHAVACAQYHYLSNQLGGVRVQYMYESDRKAWVRYVPPRWIWAGTATCGVPSEVSRAMLRGWHGHNGVSLGNPRLGFVCTKQTTDGQPGLEGYYLEDDRELAPEERVRFAPGEDGPDFDPARAPRAEGPDWPAQRRRKVSRNFAMDFVRTALPVLGETFGYYEYRHLFEDVAIGQKVGVENREQLRV